MAVATLELRPFTSLLIGQRPNERDPDGFIAQALADIKDLLSSPGSATRTFTDIGLPEKRHRLWVGWISFIEARPPTWAPTSDLVDEVNHLAVVALRRRHVGIYTSDPWLARRLAKLGEDCGDAVGALTAIPVGTLNAAFTHGPHEHSDDPELAGQGAPVRTLWLSGIHRRTESKPDSKVLAGLDLTFALDPLGDQSYYATAARASVELPDLPADKRLRAVGFNSRKSRVWAGPSRDWDEFTRLVYAILGQIRHAAGEEPDLAPIPVLATPVSGTEDVAGAYDMSVIAPELLSNTVVPAPEVQQRAERWAYDARFEVTPRDGADFTADVYLRNDRIGTLEFRIAVADDGAATMKIAPDDPDDPTLQDAVMACEEASWLTVRYESGHTLADRLVYATRFRDVQFSNWEFWPMAGFDVTKEKPPTSRHFDPMMIGESDSLFCWVKKNWPPPTGANPGWLACDDGAGEIADFIHVDPAARLVTLIHVKASHSEAENREISTSDYEIVVGQAVKNLRFLDRINLVQRLLDGSAKSVAQATWLDGQNQGDRADLVEAVGKMGEDYDRRVVVLQPRVTSREYQWARNEQKKGKQKEGKASSKVKRLLQLDALLLEAQSACRDLGAEFVVIGEQV